ncbi:MAG: hypothetical protein IPG47_08935 [Thermoflexaceae bacterium]|nr:hypothetical protein [Thermoflexaceae bacterium]
MPSGESVHAEPEKAAHAKARTTTAGPGADQAQPGGLDLRAPGPAHVLSLQRVVGNRAVGRRLAPSAGPVAVARKTAGLGPAAAASVGGVVQRVWTSAASLSSHFSKHSSDFSYGSEEEYSDAADEHYDNRTSFQSKVSNGKTYVYDDATDTLGVYTSAGKTITFFKPCHNNSSKVAKGDGQTYYDNQ